MSNVFIGVDQSGTYRVYLAVSTQLVEEARQVHQTTPLATAALGRVLTGTALMGLMLKEEKAKVTVLFKGDGPLEQILATANGHGQVKGYVANPGADLPLSKEGKLDVGGGMGQGELTVIKDIGLKEPQSGRIALVTGEIADDLTAYFYISEQQNSSVALGVMVDRDHHVKHAGGMMIQMLPGGERTTAVDYLERLLEELPPLTTLLEELEFHEERAESQRLVVALAHRIFREMPEEYRLKEIDAREISWHCDCSRQRLEQVVMAMGPKDLETIIQEDGEAELVCSFCNKKYYFDRKDLEEIYRLMQED
jgi:molecular chaperone Hsp33